DERGWLFGVLDECGHGQIARDLVPDCVDAVFVSAVLTLEPRGGVTDVVQSGEVGDEPSCLVWGHVEFVGNTLADTGRGVVVAERERRGAAVAEVPDERICARAAVSRRRVAPFPGGRLHDRDSSRSV